MEGPESVKALYIFIKRMVIIRGGKIGEFPENFKAQSFFLKMNRW